MRRLLAFVLIGLLGCADDGDDAAGGNVAVDDFDRAYRQAACSYITRCGLLPDMDTCLVARLSDAYALEPDLVAAIRVGRVVYSGENVKTCFDAIAEDTCDATDEIGRVEPLACREMTTGTVGDGGDCHLDAECISGDCESSTRVPACAIGHCVGDSVPSHDLPAIGEACTANRRCARGAYCDSSNTCRAQWIAGQTCGGNEECFYGLGCDRQVCAVLPRAGEPCTSRCRDVGTVCSYSSSGDVCGPIGLAGGSCTGKYFANCSPFYSCFRYSTGEGAAVCRKPPSSGEACEDSCFEEGYFCDPDTRTCIAERSDGESCTAPGQCQSGNCDPIARTCATRFCIE